MSRDLARIAPATFRISSYTARQSWISAVSPAVRPPEISLESSFQRRMVESDFASSALGVLASSEARKADVVLLDLIDERLGVLPWKGSWLTASGELKRSGVMPPSAYRSGVAFGSDQHFGMWSDAATEIRKAVGRVIHKTFVLAPRFASTTQDGGSVLPWRGQHGEVWNELYARYYETLVRLGFAVLTVPPEMTVSTQQHHWGPAPYHYIDEAYLHFSEQIVLRMEKDRREVSINE